MWTQQGLNLGKSQAVQIEAPYLWLSMLEQGLPVGKAFV